MLGTEAEAPGAGHGWMDRANWSGQLEKFRMCGGDRFIYLFFLWLSAWFFRWLFSSEQRYVSWVLLHFAYSSLRWCLQNLNIFHNSALRREPSRPLRAPSVRPGPRGAPRRPRCGAPPHEPQQWLPAQWPWAKDPEPAPQQWPQPAPQQWPQPAPQQWSQPAPQQWPQAAPQQWPQPAPPAWTPAAAPYSRPAYAGLQGYHTAHKPMFPGGAVPGWQPPGYAANPTLPFAPPPPQGPQWPSHAAPAAGPRCWGPPPGPQPAPDAPASAAALPPAPGSPGRLGGARPAAPPRPPISLETWHERLLTVVNQSHRRRMAVLGTPQAEHRVKVHQWNCSRFLTAGVYDVPGDGECQFHVLGLGMALLIRLHSGNCPVAAVGTNPDGAELWSDLATSLRSGKSDCISRAFLKKMRRLVVSSVYANHDRTMREQIGFADSDRDRWENGGSACRYWGNDMTLSEACNILGLRVHVIKIEEDEKSGTAVRVRLDTILCNEPGKGQNGTIHMLARGDYHYQYLCVTERGSPCQCPKCLPYDNPQQYALTCGRCLQRIPPR